MRLLQESIWPVKLLHLTLVHHLQREREEGSEKEVNVNSLFWLQSEACQMVELFDLHLLIVTSLLNNYGEFYKY